MQSLENQSSKRIWRRPTKREGEIIISKLEYFGEDVPKNVLVGHDMYVLEIFRREVHLVKRELSKAIEVFKPYSAGITFGELKGRTFMLSLAGGYLVARYATRKRVMLDKEGSIKFIYGEDVEGPDIDDWDEDIEDNDVVIVLSDKGEFLGFGKAIVRNLRVIKVENIVDIGWYLRSEMNEI